MRKSTRRRNMRIAPTHPRSGLLAEEKNIRPCSCTHLPSNLHLSPLNSVRTVTDLAAKSRARRPGSHACRRCFNGLSFGEACSDGMRGGATPKTSERWMRDTRETRQGSLPVRRSSLNLPPLSGAPCKVACAAGLMWEFGGELSRISPTRENINIPKFSLTWAPPPRLLHRNPGPRRGCTPPMCAGYVGSSAPRPSGSASHRHPLGGRAIQTRRWPLRRRAS